MNVEPLVRSFADTQLLLGGVSRPHIYTLIDLGELETVPVGGRRMITMESITRLVSTRREPDASQERETVPQ